MTDGKPMRPCYNASFMVKFLGKRDHAEKFLSGAMLARRLKYFQELEDDPARWDPNDGLRDVPAYFQQAGPSEQTLFTRRVRFGGERMEHLAYVLWSSPTP